MLMKRAAVSCFCFMCFFLICHRVPSLCRGRFSNKAVAWEIDPSAAISPTAIFPATCSRAARFSAADAFPVFGRSRFRPRNGLRRRGDVSVRWSAFADAVNDWPSGVRGAPFCQQLFVHTKRPAAPPPAVRSSGCGVRRLAQQSRMKRKA